MKHKPRFMCLGLMLFILSCMNFTVHASVYNTELTHLSVSASNVNHSFPDTRAPELYVPENETEDGALRVNPDVGMNPGNLVENIEEYEEGVTRRERSYFLDAFMYMAGGISFGVSVIMILAYSIDRVNVIPRMSLIKLITRGKHTIYTITAKEYILKTMVLLVTGILLGSGMLKKILSMIFIIVNSYT